MSKSSSDPVTFALLDSRVVLGDQSRAELYGQATVEIESVSVSAVSHTERGLVINRIRRVEDPPICRVTKPDMEYTLSPDGKKIVVGKRNK